MFQWLREYLEIRAEFRERRTRLTHEVTEDNRICQSCETLKEQLAFSRDEVKMLLNKIVREPEHVVEPDSPPMIQVPKNVPWNVRRQMLEAEDRAKAKIMREVPKPLTEQVTKEEIAEFEQELNSASKARETRQSS